MRRNLSVLAFLLLGSATPLFAAEGGLLSVQGGLIFWTLVIFGIVFATLYFLAFPKILGAVEAREAHIRELTEAAERDRAAAAALLAEQTQALEKTRNEVQQAVAEGRATAEQLREDILAQARREQEELMLRARRDIQTERAAALESMRRETVDLAMAAAERLLRRNLSDTDNRRLVTDYLDRVEVATPATAGV